MPNRRKPAPADPQTPLTITAAAELLQQRRLSCEELVEGALERIDSLEPSIRAWAEVDREGAREMAARRQRELRQGLRRSALHGIPVGIKDIVYTHDLPTRCGSPIYADFRPAFDATVVRLLQNAGAVVLGKTATTEFAFFDPAPTRNPWRAEHTPGGSSSGSAAAVAAGMCLLGVGSQTAGSIIRPAAYCGVVGLKPTFGRVSRHGVFPCSSTLDHVGFMTRSVEDAAVVLQLLAGHDPQDPDSLGDPLPYYFRAAGSGRPPRIGILDGTLLDRADEPTRLAFDATLDRFRAAGARMTPVAVPPTFGKIHDAHRTIMQVETASVHAELFGRHRGQYGPKLREFVDHGLTIPGVDLVEAYRLRRHWLEELAPLTALVDVVVTPSAPSAAPAGLSSTGDPWFNIPWTLAGYPAITLPSGLTEDGLPLGIQLATGPLREEQLFAAAHWCEQIIGSVVGP